MFLSLGNTIGVLRWYVIRQIVSSFALALLTLTGVIVLFMVMAEATRQGLPPQAVLRLIPYIVPGTLPYTIPVALLFSVSVVYGRMAGDNEVIAVKAAGCSVWKILNPSIGLGAALALALVALSVELIPRANHAFKTAIFKDAEDMLYFRLKSHREFDNPRWPFFLGVKDVRDRVLIGATFKHRSTDPTDLKPYDYTVQADEAVIRFDAPGNRLVVDLKQAVMQGETQVFMIPDRQSIPFPLPEGGPMSPDKKVQEMTSHQIDVEHAVILKKIAEEKAKQAIAASLWIAAGQIDRVDWPHIRDAYRDDARWRRQSHELETEREVRFALAFSVLFFVILGAPVGILFAKRDFLSAFITCFVPIIILYYPLVLAGINMGKEGIIFPQVTWAGNVLLAVLAGLFAIPPVTRH